MISSSIVWTEISALAPLKGLFSLILSPTLESSQKSILCGRKVFGEFVLSLPSEQYIAWVDHTLPDYKWVKGVKKCVNPFTKPMKVGNITLDRIGSHTNLYKKDIYGITSYTDFKGRRYENGVIFFHVTDSQKIDMHMAVHEVLNNWKKQGWL